MPTILSGKKWRLVYSKKVHGKSYNTLLSKCSTEGPVMLVVLDYQGNVFGGFVSVTLEQKPNYFGTGETFLYKLEHQQMVLTAKMPTMDNLYFLHCSPDGIGFGSDPHFGLFINSELDSGSSHTCKTFDNQPLSSKTEFGIKRIELWAIDLF